MMKIIRLVSVSAVGLRGIVSTAVNDREDDAKVASEEYLTIFNSRRMILTSDRMRLVADLACASETGATSAPVVGNLTAALLARFFAEHSNTLDFILL